MSKEDREDSTALLTLDFQKIVSDMMNLIVVKHRLPMAIFETLRSQERQQWLFDNGRSKTLSSNHSTGRAIDIVVFIDGKWMWEDKYDYYYQAANCLIKGEMGSKVKWGGEFVGFCDPNHWEMH